MTTGGSATDGLGNMWYRGCVGGLYVFNPQGMLGLSGSVQGQTRARIWLDMDKNGIQDSNEYPLPNTSICLLPSGTQFQASSFGAIPLSINFSSPQTLALCNLDTALWEITTDSLTYALDSTFLLNPHDLVWGIGPKNPDSSFAAQYIPERGRCFSADARGIYVQNTGNQLLHPMTITNTADSLTYSFSWNPIPAQTAGNQMVLQDTTVLLPGSGRLYTGVYYSDHVFGDTIQSIYSVQVGSNTLTDTAMVPVTCSYDPNDKTPEPFGVGPKGCVLHGTEVVYRIRFQNTGNDTAYSVTVLDTIDQAFAPESFAFLGSSHPVVVQRRASGALQFRFERIMLPDSFVNEPASNGWLLYRVKPLAGLPDSTQAATRAYIHFDLNAPVITNDAITTFVSNLPSATAPARQEAAWVLAPNPAQEMVLVSVPAGAVSPATRILLYDLSGKLILETPVQEQYTSVSLQDVPVGMYHAVLQQQGQRIAQAKLVVMH